MSHRYNAFLIRHWSLDADQGTRIEITHVATGRSMRATSLNAALAWMQEVVGGECAAERSPPADERSGELAAVPFVSEH